MRRAEWTIHVALLYSDLIAIAPKLEDNSTRLSERKSALTGKTGYLTHLNLVVEDSVGNELFDDAQIDGWLNRWGNTSTSRVYLSRIRWWQESYYLLLQSQDLPKEPAKRFVAAVELAVSKHGNMNRLAKAAGWNHQRVRRWLSGSSTLPSEQETLRTLETVAGLLPGTLEACIYHRESRTNQFCEESRMPEGFQGSSNRAYKLRSRLRWMLPEDFPIRARPEQDELIAKTAEVLLSDHIYMARTAAVDARYYLPIGDMPDWLQAEISDFIRYKTADTPPPGMKRHKNGRVRSPKTIRNWDTFFSSFFGWCMLPSEPDFRQQHGRTPTTVEKRLVGPGLRTEDLTLGLFLVPELVSAYMGWLTNVRSDGPSHSTLRFLSHIQALVREDTGYVAQKPELLERVPGPLLAPYHKRYVEWLEQQREGRITAINREIERAQQLLPVESVGRTS